MSSVSAYISRGKRHGRAYRARVRRRRALIFTSAAAFSTALGGAFSIASFTGVDLAHAAVEKAHSLSDLIGARSPGERTLGQLSNTKHKHQALADHQAAPEAKKPLPKNLADALAPVAEAPVTLPAPVPELALSSPPPDVFFSPPPGGGGVIVPPGSPPGGGPGGPPNQPPPNQPPPNQPPPNTPPPNQPPAVPEPGTWMTMILGFGVIGWSLRRKPAERAAASR
jgi:hypothetical protein